LNKYENEKSSFLPVSKVSKVSKVSNPSIDLVSKVSIPKNRYRLTALPSMYFSNLRKYGLLQNSQRAGFPPENYENSLGISAEYNFVLMVDTIFLLLGWMFFSRYKIYITIFSTLMIRDGIRKKCLGAKNMIPIVVAARYPSFGEDGGGGCVDEQYN
jgi:hypothetical protein